MALSFKPKIKTDELHHTELSPSFVLISCDSNMVHVADEFRTISMVTEVTEVLGIYDIVVTIKSDSNKIRQTIAHKIRMIKGISLTLLVIDFVV